MKVAVVGAGIAGLAAAHALQKQAEVVLFESERRIGGHTDTHAILSGGRTYRVDSGFTAFNEHHYPAFSAWLAELGVASRPADVSFGYSNRVTGLEYGTRHFNALFCRRRSLVSPRFLAMLRDLRRFAREAARLAQDDDRSLERFLADTGFGAGFRDDLLAPLCAAHWSLSVMRARELPVVHVAAFLTQHPMLQGAAHARWRVVEGGASSYLQAFVRRFRGMLRVGEPALGVARSRGRATLTTRSGRHDFDAVVLACHSDQALAMLEDPSPAEREVLGAIRYRRSRVVVHSDTSVMPQRRSAWSGWNAVVDGAGSQPCHVTFWMNRLQSLDRTQPFFVTLNPQRELDSVWSARDYAQPVFTREARRAQRRRDDISGVDNTHYCGAYWGWGGHEDGFTSGVRVAQEMRQGRARAA